MATPHTGQEACWSLIGSKTRKELSTADRTSSNALSELVRLPEDLARWSCRTLTRYSGLSGSAVQWICATNDLKPHQIRTFKLTDDPQFEAKFRDIIGLYLDPAPRAIVLCCEQKSRRQALEQTQPELSLGQGRVVTRTHDYHGQGTVTRFATLNYLNEEIFTERSPRHRY